MSLALLLTVVACFMDGGPAKLSPAVDQPPAPTHRMKFAENLLRATGIIAAQHERPVSQSHLILWAVEGLYQEHKKPLPAELVQRLAAIEKVPRQQRWQLLDEVCGPFVPGDGAGADKILGVCLSAVFLKLEPGANPADRSSYGSRNTDCVYYRTDLYGVGLKIISDPESGMLQVVTPTYQAPAHQAGLRAGDVITNIVIETDLDGRPLPRPQEFSTKGMSTARAQELFLGQAGSKVTLKVIRAK